MKHHNLPLLAGCLLAFLLVLLVVGPFVADTLAAMRDGGALS